MEQASNKRPKRTLSDYADDELIRTPQVAECLGVSTSYLQKGRTNGTGPDFIRLGRSVRYRRREVQDWLERKMRSSTRTGYALRIDGERTMPAPEEIISWLVPPKN